MNPDGDEAVRMVFGRQVNVVELRAMLNEVLEDHMSYLISEIDDQFVRYVPHGPKFQEGDLVMITKSGKTGFVDESFYDEDCPDLVVRLTNNDMHLQSDLTLICSSI